MKILFLDIETSPITYTGWGMRDQNHNPDDILEDWKMISAAWSWSESEQISAIGWKATKDRKISPLWGFDDRQVVEALHRQICKADVLCAHNGDAFDIKKFNARCIKLGLKPIPPLQTIDTLKVARKHFKFTSNKLDYIGQFLDVGAKIETSKGLWNRVIRGDKEALKEMIEYNKQDVVLLKRVYEKLRPWMQNHPNNNLFRDKECCPGCGSENTRYNGYIITRTRRYKRVHCQDCGKWSQGPNVKHPVKVK